MPRYVILFHATPAGSPRASHYDFMLEAGAVLRTWALAELPADGISVIADALADHRLAYLSLEGPISGDRGIVSQWDAGEYELISATNDELRCELRGQRLRGTVELVRATVAGGDAQRWRFGFRNK